MTPYVKAVLFIPRYHFHCRLNGNFDVHEWRLTKGMWMALFSRINLTKHNQPTFIKPKTFPLNRLSVF